MPVWPEEVVRVTPVALLRMDSLPGRPLSRVRTVCRPGSGECAVCEWTGGRGRARGAGGWQRAGGQARQPASQPWQAGRQATTLLDLSCRPDPAGRSAQCPAGRSSGAHRGQLSVNPPTLIPGWNEVIARWRPPGGP